MESQEKMTLDEAIAHARKVAEENYLQGMLCHANPNDEELDGCIECAKEHEQLAEWLEELKELRAYKEKMELRKKYHCEDCSHLVNQKKGPRGSITGMCELRNWRGRRAGRTVACKKFKEYGEQMDNQELLEVKE